MLLSSTVADITIAGTADLVAQTFDYEFAVRPGVSKTLPVIGAIAGGPVGAAAGLALQAIFRDALGEATEARYTITGPWEDPQVEPVNKVPKSGTTDVGPIPGVSDGDKVEQDQQEAGKEEAGVTGDQQTGEQTIDGNIND
jgi:hypothetical protein